MSKNIPSLSVRKKWNKVQQIVKVNSIVLLYNNNMPRSFWPLARVNKINLSQEELVRSVTLKLLNTTVWPVNELYLWEEFSWIGSNEFSLGVEEFCIYWHCIRRQNRNVALSVVSLSALICVPFAGIYLHFSRVLVSRLWGVAVNVMYSILAKKMSFLVAIP